jgi:hypothetical protein
VAKIDNLARIANAIQQIAAGGTPNPALTEADFSLVGLTGATPENLPAVLAAIAAKSDDGSETDSLSALQTIVTAAAASAVQALANLSGFAQDNTSGLSSATGTVPTLATYVEAGVVGVNANNLDAINDAIEGQAMEEDDANALETREMTPALAEQVINPTGATTFAVLPDGRLGTCEEAA